MLADSKVQFLLIDNPSRHFNCQFSMNEKTQPATVFSNPQPATRSSQLAYVIYTSGTTGKPKGVVNQNRGVVNTLLFRKDQYQMNPDMTSLQLFSPSFDGFVTSFFTPIISGAKVVLLNKEEIRDTTKIKDIIREQKVTHFICIPVLYRAIIGEL